MNENSKSELMIVIRKIASLVLTLFFLLAAALMVWSGSDVIASRAQAVDAPDATQPLLVSVATLTLEEEYAVQRRFTGQLEAPQVANLSFEQGGTLSEVLVDEGDAVEAGQILARLDNRTLAAEVDRLLASRRALTAQLELANLTNDRQVKLSADGFASAQASDQARINVAELKARIAETDAGIVAARVRLEKSEIKAPFNGALNSRLVDPGNAIAGGQVVVSVVQQSRPVFRVGLDPEVATEVSAGDPLKVFINGESVNATVISVLPQIDAATRTQTIRASLNEATSSVLGLTGEAVFTQKINANGAWIPVTALEDGIRGLWTIKTVTDDEPATVQIEAVEIIYSNSDSAFVTGTFTDNIQYIDDGVHRVVAGQTVRVQQ